MTVPCKGCADRVPGDENRASCHATCPRYAEWRAEKDAALEAHRRAADHPAAQYINDTRRRRPGVSPWRKPGK